ncbi:cortactin-binding protein 2 [Striga asiatica]|uniref:Cortactin-binding protein 2 n=1 Tax=Striga asiatica TaxID=4170 RepID=A0A5A7PXJ9_STRAF|nr:cortactin-binding protein 2 [Striga asiatica]
MPGAGAKASSSIANPPTAPAGPCLSQQYDVPFHVVSTQEDVKRYLSLLGLTVFENIVQETFPKLTLEFFSTVAMHDNGKYLTALLKGKECKVTDAILNGLFEFGTEEAARYSPMGWKADPYWPLISPCTSFKKTGNSSRCITDAALGIVHKYLCHMIFGKRESNKVSEQQVFILWSIAQGKPVSMLQYLQNALFDIRHDTRRGPNLGHIVTCIAKYFKVQIDKPALESEFNTERDLSSAGFIYDRFHIRPVHERKSYKNYLEDLLKRGPASEPSHTAVGPSGAGTSFVPPLPARQADTGVDTGDDYVPAPDGPTAVWEGSEAGPLFYKPGTGKVPLGNKLGLKSRFVNLNLEILCYARNNVSQVRATPGIMSGIKKGVLEVLEHGHGFPLSDGPQNKYLLLAYLV